MAQLLTVTAICTLSGYLFWKYADRLFGSSGVQVSVRLDRPEPSGRLVWDILNTGDQAVTVTKLIVRGRGGAADLVPQGLPKVLGTQDRITLPTDVDWPLLAASSIAVADATGQEHRASRRQLTAVQDQLGRIIDRRCHATPSRDFLPGAVAVAMLGFFMLIWAIATR